MRRAVLFHVLTKQGKWVRQRVRSIKRNQQWTTSYVSPRFLIQVKTDLLQRAVPLARSSVKFHATSDAAATTTTSNHSMYTTVSISLVPSCSVLRCMCKDGCEREFCSGEAFLFSYSNFFFFFWAARHLGCKRTLISYAASLPVRFDYFTFFNLCTSQGAPFPLWQRVFLSVTSVSACMREA